MRERRLTSAGRAAAVAHRVLGLDPTATCQDTRRAYRLLASLTHPDHRPGDPRAAAEFRTVHAAAEVLTALRRGRTPAPHQVRTLLDLPRPGPDPRVVAAYCSPPPAPSTIDLVG